MLVSLAKGLDPATGHRLSHVLAAHVGGDPERVAVLSGPNHAEEIARGTPAASVVAADSADLCRRLQSALSTPRFRVYANADLVGVELCAATKNVIAIAAGASDGLGYGDNAKAALYDPRARRDELASERRSAPTRAPSRAWPASATSS